MTIGYPAFYKGGYPNIENLLAGLFASPQVGLSGVDVTYWLPDEQTITDTLAAGQGFLRIYRVGGRINRPQNRDEPNVQLAALTASRDESWELIEFARTGVLEQFADAAIVPGTPHMLHCAGELVGPQLIPELIRDERLVPITVALHTWRPGGLGNYREALGL